MITRPTPLRAAVVLAALAALVVSPPLMAAPKPPPGKGGPPAAEGGGDKDKPYTDWKKVTKDSEAKKGFLSLYQKRENLYVEITPDQFDKPVLGIFSLARGI